jgi:hypothetical protein
MSIVILLLESTHSSAFPFISLGLFACPVGRFPVFVASPKYPNRAPWDKPEQSFGADQHYVCTSAREVGPFTASDFTRLPLCNKAVRGSWLQTKRFREKDNCRGRY